ncbi:MAG: endonuclease/exonuclease/phosphatase family protein [Candidatus Promineifilaceae bacterium]|jgi:endonuclease/exonuclease/phosphatase family metal-dependent hydrolase
MDTPVTVATISIHGREDRWPERRSLLVAQLMESGADLISLQEINTPIRQAVWLCKQINVRLSGSDKEPYRLVQKGQRRTLRGSPGAIGVLSRLPILYSESLSLGYGGRFALRAHIELPSHQTMDFVTTQLHLVPFEKEARHDQALKMMAWLYGHKRVPIQVIAGDMGESPEGLAVQHIKQSFRSAYETFYGRDPLATYPTVLSNKSSEIGQCRDYVFISTAVRRVSKVEIFCDESASEDNTLYPSDHVGLLATLQV